MLTEICGCLAEMFFYKFAKEGSVGETEEVANLLDAVVGLLQVIADVLKDVFRNPFVGGFARMLLAESREVFGRDTEFVGIPFHRAMLYICGVQKVEEMLEVIIVGMDTHGNVIVQHTLFQGATEFKDTSTQQSLDRRIDAYADYQNKLLEYHQATGQYDKWGN